MQNLSGPEADLLPDRIMASLGESTHGYLAELTAAMSPHLPQDTLSRWDGDLKKAIADRQAEEKMRKADGWFYSMISQWAPDT